MPFKNSCNSQVVGTFSFFRVDMRRSAPVQPLLKDNGGACKSVKKSQKVFYTPSKFEFSALTHFTRKREGFKHFFSCDLGLVLGFFALFFVAFSFAGIDLVTT